MAQFCINFLHGFHGYRHNYPPAVKIWCFDKNDYKTTKHGKFTKMVQIVSNIDNIPHGKNCGCATRIKHIKKRFETFSG